MHAKRDCRHYLSIWQNRQYLAWLRRQAADLVRGKPEWRLLPSLFNLSAAKGSSFSSVRRTGGSTALEAERYALILRQELQSKRGRSMRRCITAPHWLNQRTEAEL